MEQKVLIFGDQNIDKSKLHTHKKPITIDKIEIKQIVLSKRGSYESKGAFKCFIGYKSNHGVTLFYIKLLQMYAYAKFFESNKKYMNFLFHDKEILRRCNEIWDKVKNLFKKEFNR